MYYSIADQLEKVLLINKDCEELREMTCNYMLQNKDEFLPYLDFDDDSGNGQEKYEEYCNKIKDQTVWGGQIELKALSDVLNVLIEVIQSEGSEILFSAKIFKLEKISTHSHKHVILIVFTISLS